jgi:hypothetical protein
VHPDDVAECVAEEVELLRTRLIDAPDLHAAEPELRDRFELRVPFKKIGHRGGFVAEIPARMSDALGEPAMRVVKLIPVRVGRVERDLVLRCFCDDYDGQAITAELLLPNGQELPGNEWPRTLGREAIIHGHEDYDRPFFCRRGLREYHSHPQHEDNPWDAHREMIRIYDIVPELIRDLQTRWNIG